MWENFVVLEEGVEENCPADNAQIVDSDDSENS
jgi:hypothetical protein